MEQIQELPNGKCIRKYSPEYALFDAGTRLWATKYYQDLGSMVQPEENVGKAAQAGSITCRLAKCNVDFQSVVAYEEHYDMVHRNVCRECSRSFLSSRLLDIHISETHDAFFKILSKKQPMYVCLVDGCPSVFQHNDKRIRHLIQVHQYPESFSFQQRRKQTKPGNGAAGNKGVELQPEVDTETIKKREARRRRRQQKKKKLLEKTKRHDDYVQVDGNVEAHDAGEDVRSEIAESEVADVEMDGIEERMRKLHIPKSIRFGRKRRA